MLTLTITNKIQIPYHDEKMDDFLYGSLTMPNPTWVENHRMGRFNWKTPKELFFYEEFDKEGLLTPRGFLLDIVEYCEINNIKYQINNQTHIFKNIDIKFSGELHPFQKIAIKEMLSQNIGTLCAPTGSGKTVMGIYMICNRQQPTIIIVHTKELLYQWIERLKEFTDIKNHQIGMIGDSKLDEEKEVTIALIQTLRKYPEIVNTYSHLIVDECHRCPSKIFTDVVTEFSGRYITGLSATPYRRDGLSKCIEWYCGSIMHEINPQELIQKGHITGIKSTIRETNFISTLEDPAAEYSKLLQELSLNKERNQMIVDDIIKVSNSGETCLVLSDRKIHCQKLANLITEKSNIPMTILTGDVSPEPRKQIVENVNNGKIKILIATGQLIGEGFDCKNLSALFLTLPIKFSGRIIQYLGRVLRPKKGKNKAIIYDYFDPAVKCLYGSMKNRKREYKKLEV